MIGRTISQYKILDKLGEGGMGVVYKARDTRLDRTVALKFLSPQLLDSQQVRDRFTREAKAAAALDHPNICTVYDIGEADDQLFLAMPFVDGETLQEKIERRPLPLAEALGIAIQTAEGLHAAHKKNIVHRDIKSANIMIDPDGRPKIMDFGLAQLGGKTRITKAGGSVGTPAYMSPEQVRGETVDPRTDIWSLGVVLYEMLVGRLPFRGDVEGATAYSIQHTDPEPVTAQRAGLPLDVDRILTKALAKDPEERYQHADDLVADLRTLKRRQESSEDSRIQPAIAEAAPKKRRLTWYVSCAVLAVVVGGGLWFSARRTEPPAIPLTAVPLTSFPGAERNPNFSPDGNQVAFAWNGENQDNFDIYVVQIGNPTPLRLTDSPDPDISPAWSPDGRHIAFLQYSPGRLSVMQVPAIGGSKSVLAEWKSELNMEAILRPARRWIEWFPDGKWLAVEGLKLISTETGAIRRLTSPPEGLADGSPAVSPDGRTIVFSRRTGDPPAWEIFSLRLSGDLSPRGDPQQLTALGYASWNPAWTPDGAWLVFSRSAQDIHKLWRVPASGGEARELLSLTEGKAAQPALSRQGQRMAYNFSRTSDADIWQVSLDESGGAMGAPTPFISSSYADLTPAYSPDGRRIVFPSNRLGRRGLWLADADGGNQTELYGKPDTVIGSPSWSPDGQRIAFDMSADGQMDIFTIGIRGGHPVRLTTDSSGDWFTSWSRDGKWVYFCSARTGRMEVWKAPSGGGTPIQVTPDGGTRAVESPDGRYLYYPNTWGMSPELWRAPTSGGPPEKVLDGVQNLAFTVAETGIYFVPPEAENGARVIKFHEFRTNSDRTIVRVPGVLARIGPPSVSPDGRCLLFVRDEEGSDIMLVENFR